MLDNKRAQIGDTMTWVVATLVIVVILGILVFATIWISGNKLIFLDDKEKDFMATKSITSFLNKKENVDLLKSDNGEEIEMKIEKLTEIMLGSSLQSAWDFELSDEEGNEIEVAHKYPAPGDSQVVNAFEIKILLKKIELKYWKKCTSICK